MLSALLLATAHAGPVCVEWAEPALLATCDSGTINESSGVAFLESRPGVWMTHNDAGGAPELYAFDESGVHLGTHLVEGATFRDWEDLAAGPCPAPAEGARCLFIGDIGDNGRSRESIEVFAVEEPAEGAAASVVAAWRVAYPTGAEDAEALAVHPCTGRVYVLTKESGDGNPAVWVLPEEPVSSPEPAPLSLVATMPQSWFRDSGRLTGADWSPGGDRLLVRTYGHAFVWDTDPAAPEAHWLTAPTEIPLDAEGQGESIAWHPDGGALSTTEGVPMRISRVACASAVEGVTCPDVPDEPTDTGDSGQPGDSGDPADSAAPDSAGETGGPDDPLDRPGTSPPDTDQECGCGGGSAAALWALGLGVAARRRQGA